AGKVPCVDCDGDGPQPARRRRALYDAGVGLAVARRPRGRCDQGYPPSFRRMTVMTKAWLILPLVFLAPLASRAADSGGERACLVAFPELEKRLGEPDLRILDARPKADYEKGHIPGAVWVDAKAVESMAAKPGALTDRASWEKWIAPLGIGPKTDVVVYDARRQLDAPRIWWVLR